MSEMACNASIFRFKKFVFGTLIVYDFRCQQRFGVAFMTLKTKVKVKMPYYAVFIISANIWPFYLL